MADETELSPELIAQLARRRGLAIDAARAAGFAPGLNSLVGRCRRLAELLPREMAPPPSRAPE
jgi:hypothetical protein